MDKKKVIDKIERTLQLIREIYGFSVDDNEKLEDVGFNLKDVLSELSKSDWVSVEDELPPYDKEVLACSKIEPTAVWIDSRDKFNSIDNGFRQDKVYGNSITHWKPIEKLEV